MKLVFTHNKKKPEVPLFGACEVKLYSVAAAYSDDGYFAAVWGAQELEPIPACAAETTELLAHLRVVADNDEYTIQECFCRAGVKYAKN